MAFLTVPQRGLLLMRHAMQWMAANMATTAAIIGMSNDIAMQYGTTIMARTDSKATCSRIDTTKPRFLAT